MFVYTQVSSVVHTEKLICFVDQRYWKPGSCAYFCSSPLYVVCFLGVFNVWCMCDVFVDKSVVRVGQIDGVRLYLVFWVQGKFLEVWV